MSIPKKESNEIALESAAGLDCLFENGFEKGSANAKESGGGSVVACVFGLTNDSALEIDLMWGVDLAAAKVSAVTMDGAYSQWF